jgi:putative transposase
MPRSPRIDRGDIAYHVINRAVGKMTLFEKDGDYAAFETVLAAAHKRFGLRLISYCVMPNHWHLVLWPHKDGQLRRYMQWLTVTHMRRWHAHNLTSGTGPIYQGRYKSFPIEQDDHLLTVCRYVERNPVRANLVKSARQWQWSGLWQRANHSPDWLLPQRAWPVDAPRNWTTWVDRAETPAELDALHRSVNRGAPFGDPVWQAQTARRLKLEATMRPIGRPRKTSK